MISFLVVGVLLLLIDFYIYQAVLVTTAQLRPVWKSVWRLVFWIPTFATLLAIGYWMLGNPDNLSSSLRNFLITGIFMVYISKVVGLLFLIADDIQRGVRLVAKFFYKGPGNELPGEAITRSQFLSQAALVATTIPMGTMIFGIAVGAHDYRVRRKTLHFPNLPKEFDGLRIGQLSDIHSGSFFNKRAVAGGVEMMVQEKPDVLFFTGDLVNNKASEMEDYVPIFKKLRAPLGVFSITGNHDYGDYTSWPSRAAKAANFRDLMTVHKELGFRLLMNEHALLREGSSAIAVLGVENWGKGGFAKYGKLDQAYAGAESLPFKILLSHDPSHWDAQVRAGFPDIDLTLSGHTHGFQFGIEVGNVKWSPSQYVYKQWAGLYQQGEQYIYVNRGFGYLGYPGRIGMPPELTILELKRG